MRAFNMQISGLKLPVPAATHDWSVRLKYTLSLRRSAICARTQPRVQGHAVAERQRGKMDVSRHVRCQSAVDGASSQLSSAQTPEFDLVKIPENGSCMFQALAQGHNLLNHGSLLGERDLFRRGFDVRRAVCYKLAEHREEVEPFIPGDFIAYVSYMATEGVWGGEPELAMAAKALKRPILVYQTSQSGLFGSRLSKSSQYGIRDYVGVPPVCLLFDRNHYDLLHAKG